MNIRTVLATIVLGFWSITSYATDSSVQQMRTLFQKWQSTYQKLDENEQKKQLNLLKNYPLYPYVQYQYFKTHLDSTPSNEIDQFVIQNSDFYLTPSLMRAYIEELTKQKEWKKITTLKIDDSLASRCRYQFALLKQGQKDKAFMPVQDIWLSGNDLPSACDSLFNEWNKAGGKTANLILLRIELVLKKNNIKLARYLTEQLPDNYKTLKNSLLALYDNPKKLSNFSKNISPTPFSKKIMMLYFPRLVNSDVELARSLLPTFVKQQKLTQDDELVLLKSIANNYFKDSATTEQVKWRDQFVTQYRETTLVERSIRLALKKNNMQDVESWLNLLPQADKQKDEWRYWQAVILTNHNKMQEAQAILESLTKERGFYAMYSAQRLKQTYVFDFQYPVIEGATPQAELMTLKNKYSGQSVIKRIEELRFLGMLSEASQEWRYYLYSDINQKQYAEVARYAYLQGWGEHSVQATIAGKLWNNWLERFPVVHKEIFNEFIQNKSISMSYALAIARQESALDATVRSPAGARGLMQLMPATAKDSAKKVANTDYRSAEQLYEPKMNIRLGTYYLNYVYQLFDKNRILASAAYNAGPNRVNRWLQESADDIDAIAFIESIPFTETRNYVKSVLVYDYIYQLVLKNKPKAILNENELIQQYHK